MRCSSAFIQTSAAIVLASVCSLTQAAMVSNPSTPPPQTARVQAFALGQPLCDAAAVPHAAQLIFQQDDTDAAQALAQRCNREGQLEGQALKRMVAVRIQALLAMQWRDLEALQEMGRALIDQRVVPEYVADGHMSLAFVCLANGDALCARPHLEQARQIFSSLDVPHALDQLVTLEQALLPLEAGESPP
ncbi:MAG: hypothetical protein ACOYNB_00070 [Aquabacterium sp.]|uniref:hypothetical protein n=1 Tax=Aquabacterium sp. TaxID=1872578 RepID=UPI003BDFBC94